MGTSPAEGHTGSSQDGARSASDEVYDWLKGRIVTAEWAPGVRLDPGELARRIGLSRTPIKEALSRLTHEGFVSIRPRQGTYVADISERWAQEAFDVRRVLETYAAELAATHSTDGQLQRARQIVKEGGRLLLGTERRRVVPTYLDLDAQLHRLIVECAGNAYLLSTWEQVFGHVLWARAYFGAAECRLDGIQEGHEAIVLALGRRDPAAVRRAMREHIQYARRLLLDTMDQHLSAALIGMQA